MSRDDFYLGPGEPQAGEGPPLRRSVGSSGGRTLGAEIMRLQEELYAGNTAEVFALKYHFRSADGTELEYSLLYHAILNDWPQDFIEELLSAGADPCENISMGEWYDTPFLLAVREQKYDIAGFCYQIQMAKDLDVGDDHMLQSLVIRFDDDNNELASDENIIEFLKTLNGTFDVHKKDRSGSFKEIVTAGEYPRVDVVRFLAKKFPEIYSNDLELLCSAMCDPQSSKIVEAILLSGCQFSNLHCKNSEGKTALECALDSDKDIYDADDHCLDIYDKLVCLKERARKDKVSIADFSNAEVRTMVIRNIEKLLNKGPEESKYEGSIGELLLTECFKGENICHFKGRDGELLLDIRGGERCDLRSFGYRGGYGSPNTNPGSPEAEAADATVDRSMEEEGALGRS